MLKGQVNFFYLFYIYNWVVVNTDPVIQLNLTPRIGNKFGVTDTKGLIESLGLYVGTEGYGGPRCIEYSRRPSMI